MKPILLFDLGNTLVRYYERHEFPEILCNSIGRVSEYLMEVSLFEDALENLWERVEQENYEADDFKVRPLEERLCRIFGLEQNAIPNEHLEEMSKRFMAPIFNYEFLYEDTIPILRELKEKGYRTVVVTNTPWGSPAKLWHAAIKRLGISDHVEAIVSCRDVGWRKPARQVFDYVLELLDVTPEECVFVGDNPKWDIEGPTAMGMKAVLIDRWGKVEDESVKPIRSLDELWKRI